MSKKTHKQITKIELELRQLIVHAYKKILWSMSVNEYGDESHECLSPMQSQEEKFDLLRTKLQLSLPVVKELIARFLKDQEITENSHDEIDGIDPYKRAGFITFWIVKLRPIMILGEVPDKNEMLINELLAITVACGILYGKHKVSPPFSTKLITDFKYTLRYRINTRHHIALIYEALCQQFNKTELKTEAPSGVSV